MVICLKMLSGELVCRKMGSIELLKVVHHLIIFLKKLPSRHIFFPRRQKGTFKKHWDNRVSRAYARTSFILALMSVDPNESIAHYRKAISHDASHIKAHINLGAALMNKGNTSEAISHYERAIEIKPDYAKAYNNLGVALVNQGNTSEAISILQEGY